jgi:hypothetical protein
MLFRVSGELRSGERFVARIEAPSPITAIGQARSAFQEAEVDEADILAIRCKPVKGGKSLRISKPGERKPRAAKKVATPASPAAPAKSK